MNFKAFFQTATGNPPFPYQEALAVADEFPQLLEAPTGAGNTVGVLRTQGGTNV